uniref:Reverse transcriptase domain-containing protein n=1 Tax=Strongyloides papillosus TaxID=174720 RepID=A0A0N5BQL2_STREA
QSKQKINGLLNDLEKLDTKIRSIMEKNNVKFYSTSTARLYIDESDGGYGMKSLRSEAAISYINKSLYIVFNERLEPLLELYQIMTSKGNQNPLNNASKLAEIFKFKLNFSKPNEVTINGIQINSLKEARTKVKEIIRKHENDKWLQDWGKSMKYAKTFIELKDRIELPYMKTNVSAMTFRNTYGAAEEQLFTNTHVQADRKYVGKCRKCKVAQETCYHILSCCDAWVGTLYVERHNRIARLIYEELCRKYKLKVPKVNEKIPLLLENDEVCLRWNYTIPASTSIYHRKPDLYLHLKKEGKIFLIEVSVNALKNILRQRKLKLARYSVNGEKLLKFEEVDTVKAGNNIKKDLESRMKCSVEIIPIIVGNLGEWLMEFDVYLEKLKLDIRMKQRMSAISIHTANRIIKRHLCVAPEKLI